MVNDQTPTEQEKKLLAFFAANELTLTVVQPASSIEANNHRMFRAVWPLIEDVRSGEKAPAFDFDVDLAAKTPDVAVLDFREYMNLRHRLVVCWADFIKK